MQVPPYLPRAHMSSNERGMMGAPPLGWPPMPTPESMYGYMAAVAAASAASSANQKAVC